MGKFTAKSQVRNGRTVGEVLIYGPIGPGEWFGEDAIGAQGFADLVKGLGAIDELNVRINSDGGDVADGLAIHNQLRRMRQKVTIDIDAMALSAASVVAMAGDSVRMADNALMMIHDPYVLAIGNADDLRSTADVLDKHADALVTSYHRRTGMAEADIRDLMKAETWMDAGEAKERGFVDEVVGDAPRVAAHFDPARFKNCPARFRPAAKPRLAEAQRRLADLRRGA